MMRAVFRDADRGWVALTVGLTPANGDPGTASAVIEEVYVQHAHRRRGIGGRLLTRVTADADREGVTLYLDIVPGDGMDADQLRAWYGRHGFLGRPGHMWRPAKGGADAD
jgi:GNAT superfamily N-acetyltransferase